MDSLRFKKKMNEIKKLTKTRRVKKLNNSFKLEALEARLLLSGEDILANYQSFGIQTQVVDASISGLGKASAAASTIVQAMYDFSAVYSGDYGTQINLSKLNKPTASYTRQFEIAGTDGCTLGAPNAANSIIIVTKGGANVGSILKDTNFITSGLFSFIPANSSIEFKLQITVKDANAVVSPCSYNLTFSPDTAPQSQLNQLTKLCQSQGWSTTIADQLANLKNKLTPLQLAHFTAQCSAETNFKLVSENTDWSWDQVFSFEIVNGKHKSIFYKRFDQNWTVAHSLSRHTTAIDPTTNIAAVTEEYQYQDDGVTKWGTKDQSATWWGQLNATQKANFVYYKLLGNNDDKLPANETINDGYNFRGRGYVQLTGRDVYTAFNDYLHQIDSKNPDNVVANPDLVTTKYAMDSSLFFYIKYKNLFKNCVGPSPEVVRNVTKAVVGSGAPEETILFRTQQFNKFWAVLSAGQMNLSGSVGIGGDNNKLDVIQVQYRLNKLGFVDGSGHALEVNGSNDAAMRTRDGGQISN